MTLPSTETSSASLAGQGARRSLATDVLCAAGLWALTFALYWQTRSYGFVFYDDQLYVANNPYVLHGLSWIGIRAAFIDTVVGNWHPLTGLVSMALSSLFGPSARTFHLANAALHGVAVAGLFVFLRRATGRLGPALAVAALWGFHPLRVESVAWIAELKDELSGVTWVAGLIAYGAYAHRRTPARYAVLLGVYLLALMSKPTTVTLPFVLLLTDLWPLSAARPADRSAATRWWAWRVAEKLPLLALSAVTAWIAVRGQQSVTFLVRFPLGLRIANAVAAVLAYLRQSVWPSGEAIFYPHPWFLHQTVPVAIVVLGTTVILAVTVLALLGLRRRPYLAVGWFWFLGVLVPALGFVQAGDQARADRFTYLPAMGLTMAVVWLVADWAASHRRRRIAAGAVAVIASVALAVVSARICPSWRDAETVWTRANTIVPHNYMARALLSLAVLQDGDTPRAVRLARESVDIAGDTAGQGHVALAMSLDKQGDATAALNEFIAAIKLEPGNALLRHQVGLFLIRQHRDGEAELQLQRAVKLNPALLDARYALALVLAREARYPEAIDQLQRTLMLAPHNPSVEGDLADAVRLNGNAEAAVPLYEAALADGATNADWSAQLTWLVAINGDATVAELAPLVAPAKAACDKTKNRQAFPLYAYSLVLARLDRWDDAVATGEQALSAAKASGPPDLVDRISERLTAYRKGDVAAPATRPASRGPLGPTTLPITRPASPAPAR